MFAPAKGFLRSRPGRGFLLFVLFSAAVSTTVSAGFYYSSLNWFKKHKSEEKITALQLVDAFVTNYSDLRAQLGTKAPVPATFRAHAIELFNKLRGPDQDHDFFRLQWVGRQGRQIKTPPGDTQMAQTIEALARMPHPKPVSDFKTINGQLVFRTIYPSVADQSCVDCHNALQPNGHWHVGDVMGAFAIDVPVAPFLRSSILQCLGLGFTLFLVLSGVGLLVSIVYFRNMREREAAQVSIAGSERRFRDFAESSSDWFWEEDAALRLIYLSNKVRASIDPEGRTYYGKSLRENFPAGASDEQWQAHEAVCRERRPFQNFRLQVFAADGGIRHFAISGKPIFDAAGGFAGYRGTGRDVTHEIAVELDLAQRVEERTTALRAAQHELVRKERLSALGQITATVAHELRNPLSAIRNTVFVIKDTVGKNGLNLERPITRVERNITRCDRIISDLLDYTRVRELKCTPIDADPWLADVIAEQQLGDGVTVFCALAAPGCRIACDTDRMRRVVINLLENAAQAMGELDAGHERRITVSTTIAAGAFVLAIEDTGPGIPGDILPKVFEPLFSTKSFGTGLGLPTVKQIVEQHGGTIEILSEAGQGTRAIIRLPTDTAAEIAA